MEQTNPSENDAVSAQSLFLVCSSARLRLEDLDINRKLPHARTLTHTTHAVMIAVCSLVRFLLRHSMHSYY
jgi:hypothetical protein